MNKQKKAVEFVTKSDLKARRWTEGLIEQFLPVPDEIRPNPKYASAAPMKLYRLRKVKRIESFTRFQRAQADLNSRRQAAKMATETKRRKLEEYVEGISIDIPSLAEDELARRACASYNARKDDQGYFFASVHSDRDFLDRISVNYLRHEMSRYEDELQKIAGKVGVDSARLDLKEKVLDAIAEMYPHLASECRRQWNKMWEEWRSR